MLFLQLVDKILNLLHLQLRQIVAVKSSQKFGKRIFIGFYA